MTINEADFKQLGVGIKKRRLELNFSVQQLAEKVGVSIIHLQSIENGLQDSSVFIAHRICEVLKLDPDAFDNGQFAEAKTPQELLDALEPSGTGTIEQRAVRLLMHSQISRGRLREILGTCLPNDLPKLESTGCTCPDCRNYVAQEQW